MLPPVINTHNKARRFVLTLMYDFSDDTANMTFVGGKAYRIDKSGNWEDCSDRYALEDFEHFVRTEVWKEVPVPENRVGETGRMKPVYLDGRPAIVHCYHRTLGQYELRVIGDSYWEYVERDHLDARFEPDTPTVYTGCIFHACQASESTSISPKRVYVLVDKRDHRALRRTFTSEAAALERAREYVGPSGGAYGRGLYVCTATHLVERNDAKPPEPTKTTKL